MNFIKLKILIPTMSLLIFLPLLYACDSNTHRLNEIDENHSTQSETSQEQSTETEIGTVLAKGDSTHLHELTKDTVKATCISEGYTLYTCDCGFQAKSDIIKLGEHSLSRKNIDPTCTEHGGVMEYCTLCDYSEMIEYSIEPYKHNIEITNIEASCTTPQSITSTCLRCGFSETKITAPALGHKYIPPSETAIPSAKVQTVELKNTCHCGDATTTLLKYSDYYGGAYVENTEVMAKGLDVSSWQFETDGKGDIIDINWQAIKASGIDYVILRAGTGYGGAPNYSKDKSFETAYLGAKAAGLDVGCYFYSYATSVEEIKGEAEFLLTLIKGKQFEYPVYLDVEDASQEALSKSLKTDMAIEFLSTIQERGYYGALYTGQYWLNNHFETDKILSLFDIWMAKYKTTNVWNEDVWSESYTYNGMGAYGMWQFTASADIINGELSVKGAGISASKYVDKNYCYKDYPTLIKSLGLNGFEKESDNK